jgi:hypothetical protein
MGSLHRPLWLLPVLFLAAAIGAAADSSQYSPTRIKVLTAEFHPVADSNPIPKDCDLQNFSAYCNESKNVTGESIMRVQDSDGKSFIITCSVDSRWSKCAPLAVGESYEARKGKHGLTVWIQNPNGKISTRLFRLAGDAPTPQSSAAANTKSNGAPETLSPAPAMQTTPTADSESEPTPQPVAVSPGQKASASAPLAAPAPPLREAQKVPPGSVMCNFVSTPPGAEITLDGKYAGSTPSGIALTPGTHTIEMSLPGFASWKRDLAVSEGSDLTVSATLEKQQ